ncbi:hypothetical protein [Dyella psychrodurans]|uniref:Uncharacterized protein n=1 Tax=Dyella psychrodurans TaxID=1927960 RepID=A0A370WXV5_9GAMM|nr:hypothetical protein [Dyella psychrodurans]RDS80952.1 hypothetical protein DWU99_18020 [Dyella psychrodurans]
MNDLLKTAITAHGGLDRWNAYRSVSVRLSVGGALWDFKGQSGLFADSRYLADTHTQRAILSGVGSQNHRIQFTPHRLTLETDAGELLQVRDAPRDAFAGHTNETPWDVFHAAYFDAYALWTYLTQPFLYTYPDVQTEEIEPWFEEGELWRRLKVTFPDYIATHTREQISYFGPDGLLRRHDYAVDVLGGAVGAQYVDSYHDHNGILIPHRRLIFPRGADNHKVSEPLLVSIDIDQLDLEPA